LTSARDRARSVSRAEGVDRVRALQRVLYRCAKQDRDRRFHALYDKVARSDVLERAWGEVRQNRGAAGVDGVTIDDLEASGAGEFLDRLAVGLRRPLPAAAAQASPYPEAGQAGRDPTARHPHGGRPGDDGGGEDRARADLRGRLPAHELRVSAPALEPTTPRRPSGRRSPSRASGGRSTPTSKAALTRSITWP
jgi:hypothetical protein